MFQRTCRRPESALERAVLAIRRRGAPLHPALTSFLAQHFLPGCKGLAARKAHVTLSVSRPVDSSLAPPNAGDAAARGV